MLRKEPVALAEMMSSVLKVVCSVCLRVATGSAVMGAVPRSAVDCASGVRAGPSLPGHILCRKVVFLKLRSFLWF